jgi:hypothetical protein
LAVRRYGEVLESLDEVCPRVSIGLVAFERGWAMLLAAHGALRRDEMAKMGAGMGGKGMKAGGAQGSKKMPSVAAGVRAGVGAGAGRVGAGAAGKVKAMPGVTSPAYNKGLGRMAKAGKLASAMGAAAAKGLAGKKPKGM